MADFEGGVVRTDLAQHLPRLLDPSRIAGLKIALSETSHRLALGLEFDFYPDGEDPTVGLCENCMMRESFATLPPRNEPAVLPAGYEETVCKPGKGEKTCSFLGMMGGGFRCLKGSSFESAIRQKREGGTIRAKGDNCSGPPDFTVPTPETHPKAT